MVAGASRSRRGGYGRKRESGGFWVFEKLFQQILLITINIEGDH